MKKNTFNLVTIRVIFMSMVSFLLSIISKPLYAYDPDTHYQVTYVMCRAAGLNHNDALTVAQCDQGMDDSEGTLANVGPSGIIPHPLEEGLWHALPAFSDPKLVLARKEDLFLRAINMPDRLRKLQYLGVFFHYQQDTWAHRVHPNSHATDFIPYFQPLGHAIMGHQPDRPPFDPVCALRCLEEGISYVRRFMVEGLKETPSNFFDNYSPAMGEVDGSWSGQGRFIHQIRIDNSNTARQFTTSLIRAQIDSYTNGIEFGNTNYTGYYTSNEAVYVTVRENFQRVCGQFNVPVQIPAYLVPLSTLTTPMIQSGGVLPVPPVAVPEKIITLRSVANNQFICATDGLSDNQWLYCKPGTPVSFVVEGPMDNCNLRVKGANLYFSYNNTTGAVKLWSNADGAKFSLEPQGNGAYAIKSLKFNQYVWLFKESPYITSAGNRNTSSGQWFISVLSDFAEKTNSSLVVNKTSKLLWNNTNGTISLYNLDNDNNKVSEKHYGPFEGWTAVNYADNKILWTQADGKISLWKVDIDGNHISFKEHGPFPGWTAVNCADNKVLWRHANGSISLWKVDDDGNQISFKVHGPFEGWTAVNYSNNKVLWTQADGKISLWKVDDNGNQISFKVHGPFPGWTVVGCADNKVLWRHTNGSISLWKVDDDGNQISFKVHGPFEGWTAVGYANDRILWKQADGKISLWKVDNDGNFISFKEHGPFPGWTPININK